MGAQAAASQIGRTAGGFGRALSKVSGVAAAIAAVADLRSGFEIDRSRGDANLTETKKAGGRVVGGFAAGLAGAKAGALMGAAFGPLGATIGAAAGGIALGFFGSHLGEEAATKL